MGGLAPDSELPMPETMRLKIQSIWKEIEKNTGTRFNHNFWVANTPKRSTYPACRAVICAEYINSGSGEKMILAIQNAYYLKARNPSDQNVLLSLAETLNLDSDHFSSLLNSPEIHTLLDEQINKGRQLGAQGFPTLLFRQNNKIYPLAYGFTQTGEIIERIDKVLITEKSG